MSLLNPLGTAGGKGAAPDGRCRAPSIAAAECRPTADGSRRAPHGACLEVVRLDVPKGSAAKPFAFQPLAPSPHFELAGAGGWAGAGRSPSPLVGERPHDAALFRASRLRGRARLRPPPTKGPRSTAANSPEIATPQRKLAAHHPGPSRARGRKTQRDPRGRESRTPPPRRPPATATRAARLRYDDSPNTPPDPHARCAHPLHDGHRTRRDDPPRPTARSSGSPWVPATDDALHAGRARPRRAQPRDPSSTDSHARPRSRPVSTCRGARERRAQSSRRRRDALAAPTSGPRTRGSVLRRDRPPHAHQDARPRPRPGPRGSDTTTRRTLRPARMPAALAPSTTGTARDGTTHHDPQRGAPRSHGGAADDASRARRA